jgi:hypothetical protein
LLGGVGVALRCPSAQSGGPLARVYSDIDLATTRRASLALATTLHELGYLGEERFNALHGHSRMMFTGRSGAHVDVFVDRFAMCHQLELTSRLAVHESTLSLADLLLTKLQVAELNEKDVTDGAALLLDHPLSEDESGINVAYVKAVLCRDWGWWRTVSDNLRELPGHLGERLAAASVSRVVERVSQLLAAVDDAPKSLRWKTRAKLGDRIPWRDLPEESR